MEKLKVIELFGGIGACTKALNNLNLEFEVIDYVEIDSNAVKSYNAINGTNFEPQDIVEWDKDLDVDLIMHGSPCQSFSLAGLQEGGDEGSGTRSSLMYETIRIVKKLKPKYVIWENVANLLSDKHIHNYHNYLNRMKDMGYTNYHKILSAKDYGIPQRRERIFTISILGNGVFEFPKEERLIKSYFDYLDDEYPKSVVLNDNELKMVKGFGADYSFGGSVVQGDTYPTILASYGKVCGNSGKIKCKDGYRVLTPKECWRLMGFDDEDFDKASSVVLTQALYKQAGNSIVVNVLEAILGQLFNIKRDVQYKYTADKLF